MEPLNRELEKEKFIFGCIFLFANKLQTIGDRFDKDITMKQWLLIICILNSEKGSPTLSEAAEFMGCSRQNVKKLALNLEAKDLITMTTDSKSVKLALTEKCNTFFEKRKNAENAFIDDLFKDLTKTDISNLYSCFSTLLNTITKMDEKSKVGFNYGKLENLLES